MNNCLNFPLQFCLVKYMFIECLSCATRTFGVGNTKTNEGLYQFKGEVEMQADISSKMFWYHGVRNIFKIKFIAEKILTFCDGAFTREIGFVQGF